MNQEVKKVRSGSLRVQDNYQSFKTKLENLPQIDKDKLKDVNMQPVRHGYMRILTDYAQKSPHTLSSYDYLIYYQSEDSCAC